MQPEIKPAVPAGWTPTRWQQELRRKAERCEADHPELAAQYRGQADAIAGAEGAAPAAKTPWTQSSARNEMPRDQAAGAARRGRTAKRKAAPPRRHPEPGGGEARVWW